MREEFERQDFQQNLKLLKDKQLLEKRLKKLSKEQQEKFETQIKSNQNKAYASQSASEQFDKREQERRRALSQKEDKLQGQRMQFDRNCQQVMEAWREKKRLKLEECDKGR